MNFVETYHKARLATPLHLYQVRRETLTLSAQEVYRASRLANGATVCNGFGMTMSVFNVVAVLQTLLLQKSQGSAIPLTRVVFCPDVTYIVEVDHWLVAAASAEFMAAWWKAIQNARVLPKLGVRVWTFPVSAHALECQVATLITA